jgi:hypothetical protein
MSRSLHSARSCAAKPKIPTTTSRCRTRSRSTSPLSATCSKPWHARSAYERNRAELLLQLLLLWLRDALLLRHAPDSTDLYNPDQRDTLQRFLERFPHADLAAMLEAVDSALQGVRQYLQLPLLFAVTFLRCRAAAGLSVPTELTHGVSASL